MTDREKLEWLISEVDVLIKHYVKPSTPGFQVWISEAERFLIKKYGADSFEYNKLKETRFMPVAYVSDSDVVRKCKDGLLATKLIFEKYLEELQEDFSSDIAFERTTTFDKLFIVHGHDGELKESVARIVEKQK